MNSIKQQEKVSLKKRLVSDFLDNDSPTKKKQTIYKHNFLELNKQAPPNKEEKIRLFNIIKDERIVKALQFKEESEEVSRKKI